MNSRRRSTGSGFRPPPPNLPAAPRVGPERIEALAKLMHAQEIAPQRITVVFLAEPAPLRAVLLCQPCDRFMQVSKEGWRCLDCGYPLLAATGRELIATHGQALIALAADTERPPSHSAPAVTETALAPVEQMSESPWKALGRALWKAITATISRKPSAPR